MLIDRIKKFELCIGCGLCESVLGTDRCKMKLSDKGFYVPVFSSKISSEECAAIKKLCPGVHVESEGNYGPWGKMKAISESWSSDEIVRYKAASGGVVTSIAIYLLESRKVDAILQVGVCENSYLYNELKVSYSREDVLNNSQSRYAPALIFDHIIELLDSSNDKYAFIGKPCDIAAINNLLKEYPIYKNRIRYRISIFCAGMPSYEATKKTWRQSGHRDEPIKLKYRGDGWPGNFKAEFKDGSIYEISYNESWGTVLNKYLPYRCKICPDGIGMLADLAIGDSWNTKDGYPDFTTAEGRCFCMIRTDAGLILMNEATAEGYLICEELDINVIQDKQPYQYQRRKLTGWRILPLQIMSLGILNFKGLGIVRQAKELGIKEGLNNMKGSFFRVLKTILRSS